MNSVKELFPNIYDGVREIEAISDSEDLLFEQIESEISQVKNNQFVMTSDDAGIVLFEKLFNIIPDLNTETLEFRRDRVLSRFQTTPPFTIRWLGKRLDSIIGRGNWDITLDSDNFTLYLDSSARNQQWYQEINVMMASIKPANLVFINRPYINEGISMDEEIGLRKKVFNYKLGVSWFLGSLPFASMENKGVIHMSSTSSIQTALLNDVASFLITDVAKVRINNETIITVFSTKSVSDNIATIQYEIPSDLAIEAITLVELLDSDSTILTSAQIFVPYGDDIVLKHTLTVKEG